ARVQKRPIPHAPVASPYAGASVPKIVYVSTNTPFMSTVKRVQKLLRHAEKRATASVDLANSKKKDQQKLATIARGQDQLRREEVFVKATGRAMQKALSVGRWFEGRDSEYVVKVKTGSVLVVDDVEEDDEAKEKAMKEAERLSGEGGLQSSGLVGDDSTVPTMTEVSEGSGNSGSGAGTTGFVSSGDTLPKPLSKSAMKKRKRAASLAASIVEAELPETRTRWVNSVEVAVSLR
ncbi:hypothetical protein ARAM_005511, partial [Aspergillus rambellii]